MLQGDAFRRPNRSAERRAFTLVELMIVVAIVGTLAALGLVGFRKYLNASHSSECVNMIGSIKAAQEAYRAETLSYLDVSTSLESFYPVPLPTDKKTGWGGAGDNAEKWRQLNVHVDGPVLYSYATKAGPPGSKLPTDFKVSQPPAFPATTVEPWYIIQAIGNVDGDTEYMYALASSFTNGVYIEHDDE